MRDTALVEARRCYATARPIFDSLGWTRDREDEGAPRPEHRTRSTAWILRALARDNPDDAEGLDAAAHRMEYLTVLCAEWSITWEEIRG